MKKGISLIVLGITVIVLAILSGAVLLVSAPKNPVRQAREKVYKADLDSLSQRLSEKIGNLEQTEGIDGDTIYLYGSEANEYISNIPEKYKGKIGIEAGKLVVLKFDSNDEEIEEETKIWTEEAGYKVVPKYYDPYIPTGYTTTSKASDWNSGFTIKDSNNNEFVWVPAMSLKREYMNGKQHGIGEDAFKNEYNRCFGTRDYTHLTEMLAKCKAINPLLKVLQIDDSASVVTSDSSRKYKDIVEDVETYGGFYVSKYELRVSTKVNKYNNANALKIGSNVTNAVQMHGVGHNYLHPDVDFTMMTASHYDTILAWFMSSGAQSKENVEVSSRSVGNYYYDGLKYKLSDTSSYSDKQKNTSYVIPNGSSEKTYINGIADLAGNLPEAVQGKVVGINNSYNQVLRGGSVASTSSINMCLADIVAVPNSSESVSTRIVLLRKK